MSPVSSNLWRLDAGGILWGPGEQVLADLGPVGPESEAGVAELVRTANDGRRAADLVHDLYMVVRDLDWLHPHDREVVERARVFLKEPSL